VIVSVGHSKATWENIAATHEFGVSLAAVDQRAVVTVAGRARYGRMSPRPLCDTLLRRIQP